MKLSPLRSHGPRLARWVLGLVIAVAATWGALWLGGPPLLRWLVQTQASQALGRPVQVGEVHVTPWSLQVRIRGLAVGRAQGDAATGPQLSVDEVVADLALQSLLRLAPVVDALEITAPRLSLARKAPGRHDIDDLLDRLTRESDAPAPRFAVFNIRVQGGEIVLHDEPTRARHVIDSLTLTVPVLSNLGARREVATQPRLAFRLNGSSLDAEAQTQPFIPERRTQAEIRVKGLDLTPYLPYLPQGTPVRLAAGNLDATLSVGFEQHERPRVRVSGQLALSGLRVLEQDRAGGQKQELKQKQSADQSQDLLAVERIELGLQDLRPLEGRFELGDLVVQGPRLQLRRDGAGVLNLQRLARGPWPGGQPAGTAPAPGAPGAFAISLKSLRLLGGSVTWRDAAVRPAARLELTELGLQARELGWPVRQAFAFETSARLGGAQVQATGRTDGASVQAQLALDALDARDLAPYLALWLQPRLAGTASLDGRIDWRFDAPGAAGHLRVQADRLDLQRLVLGEPREPEAALGRLALTGLSADLGAREVRLATLALDQPSVRVAREASGRWMFEDWLKGRATAAAAQDPVAPARAWDIRADEVVMRGGSASLRDEQAGGATLQVQDASVRLRGLRSQAQTQAPMALALALRVKARDRDRDTGHLKFEGSLRLPARTGTQGSGTQDAGAVLAGRLDAGLLPLHALAPYLAGSLNFDLRRAQVGFRGDLRAALPAEGAALALRGDMDIDNLRATTGNPAEPLLDWKEMDLRGLQLDVARGALQRLSVGETLLNDYFARVIIAPDGRINLQDLVRSAPAGAAPADRPTASPAAAPLIELGPMTLRAGRVAFFDRFIQPNYSANLSDLEGSLSALSNQPGDGQAGPGLADLALRGRAEGSASLEVSGRLNPLARPLALDLRGQVRDLELPPLSPYSSKYAGYGIERGKLGLDVSYRIDPSGQLSATNRITLNQLTFGEREEGSSANLPVKLIVALLADRNGVIGINLPISGSINDPQFRLGPIIARLLLNLVAKAVTSPFALLADAVAGGDDLQQVQFAAGHTVPDAAARQNLDKVAQALKDRPALNLTARGRTDQASDRAGLKRVRLEALVRTEKRRQDRREGQPATGLTPPVTAAEYPALLREAYRRADIIKPRNIVGLPRDLPQAEIEALLMASFVVTDADLRELAMARARAVNDYLATRGVPQERLFLGSSGPVGGEAGAGAGAEGGVAGVQLRLSPG